MNYGSRRASALCLILLLLLAAGCKVALPMPRPTAIASTATANASPPAPTPTPQPTPTPFEGTFCATSAGSIEDISIKSKLLTSPLQVKVYLPPCYNALRSTGYPVLYMLHGQTFLNDQWQRLGLLTAADELILAGEITPMIIVMPYELSSYAAPETSSFDEAFLQELIPYVDENYHTCSKRECRAVGGLSRGGNWAVYLGFSHPGVFAAIGAHSAPLFYGEVFRITSNLKVEGASEKLPAIYIDAGNKDENIKQVLTWVNLLKANNVPYRFTEYMGVHAEGYWSAHVADYLLWYSAEFTAGQ